MRRIIQFISVVWIACAAVVAWFAIRYFWFKHQQYVLAHTEHTSMFPYGLREWSIAIHTLHDIQHWLTPLVFVSVVLAALLILFKGQRHQAEEK